MLARMVAVLRVPFLIGVTGPQHLQQPLHQPRSIHHRLQQQQAVARVLVPRQRQQRLPQLRIAPEALRPAHQPEIELVFERRAASLSNSA